MYIRINGTRAIAVSFFLFVFFAACCGCSNSDGPLLEDIPIYPDATEVESMEHRSFGGVVDGSLIQFTTTDEYDKVVDFYTDALKTYKPEVISHKSALGRQTAFAIQRKNSGLSVAIQEFTNEGKVNISFMHVGS